MNVFVLCTGRCGSMTFERACRHASNYTTAHESGRQVRYSLQYPDNHIEVDNRLAWFLGRLHKMYPTAYYVHLMRDAEAAARSYAARKTLEPTKLLHGFMGAIKQGRHAGPLAEAREMVATVNANIGHFLRDKRHMVINIETAIHSFPIFWQRIVAEGDLTAALAELAERCNEGPVG